MRTIRIIIGFLIIFLSSVSCGHEKKDSDSTNTTDVDTTWYNFNSENEFLGLGKSQFGDLDSMIKRRRIRVLVP